MPGFEMRAASEMEQSQIGTEIAELKERTAALRRFL